MKAEKQIRAKIEADLELERRTGNGPLLLRYAAGRFWTEVGQYHAGHKDTWKALERLMEFFGPDKRLDEITDREVAALVAWRRQQFATVTVRNDKGELVQKPVRRVSPATVNRSTTGVLKKLFTRAKRVWRYQFPVEPNWRAHWLKEAGERVRELHTHEGAAIDLAVRYDFAPWLEFARLTGLRLDETLIKWEHVLWDSSQIVTTGKGGRVVTARITSAVRAILNKCKGQHPVWVFTYVCRKPRRGKTPEATRLKGQRYPITYSGARMAWRRVRDKAGLVDFRFHDIRHDVGTKLLRQTGNIKLVARVLNHADVKTTARYAHVLDSDLDDALTVFAERRAKSPRKIPRSKVAKAA